MKIKTSFFLIVTLCTSILFAETNFQSQDLESRVTALEQRPITPPLASCAKNGIGMFAYAGPILARASADGLDYAITGDYNLVVPDPGSYTLDLTSGKAHHPKFHWGWGFVVGVGGYLPYDGWDLATKWKRFHGKASGHLSRDGNPDPNNVAFTGGTGEYISPFWIAKLFDEPRLMNRASAHWHYRFDVWDLDLGREFLVSKFLALKPYIGARTAWINQNYNLKFLAHNFPTPIIQNPGDIGRQVGVRMKNDLWSIGGKVGLDTKWLLGKGFSLYGVGAFSVLEGWYKTRYRLNDQKPGVSLIQLVGPIGIGADPYEGFFVVTKRLHTIVTMADLGIGFGWEKSICKERACLSIKVGYDQSIFFGVSQFMNPQYDFSLVQLFPNYPLEGGSGPNFFTDGGNVTLSGVSGSISLDF